MPALPGENLHPTDFMDLPTLQEIQDNFAAVADVKAIITDAAGNVLTQPAPTKEYLRRQKALEGEGPQREGEEFVARIIVNEQRLGTIRMSANGSAARPDEAKLKTLSEKYGLELKQVRALAAQLTKTKNTRPAAIQFLFMMANA